MAASAISHEAFDVLDTANLRKNWLTELDPRIKFFCVLSTLLINLSAQKNFIPLILLGLYFFLGSFCGIKTRNIIIRLAVPTLVALLVFISQSLWFVNGEVWFKAGFLSFYSEGIKRGLHLALIILGGVSQIILFSMTTPLDRILKALRWFRIPEILVEIGILMHRYIFLFFEQIESIHSAQKIRMGYSNWRRSMRSLGELGGMLLIRTLDRAQMSFSAMQARAYSGRLFFYQPLILRKQDIMAAILLVLFLVILHILR
jgi:cobalt/nickel transport system permease protein